ncbi:hypothetical protein BDV37DRAFT_49560 [Aspergillus pseudonomiae]|uniref:Uncharacterized protein n=1 Tax=Aspergillus pseudonomiae TaxID=1506151 RepID=A0A5N7CU36_9EURO|nr:uncharacterized protein BDV37DRAFT_49560 [Aspergillus pseudonomiae]KAE8397716.1 hypothetical protein BDV37DRAFT_49560 [Aspergillus pseudonomiae]
MPNGIDSNFRIRIPNLLNPTATVREEPLDAPDEVQRHWQKTAGITQESLNRNIFQYHGLHSVERPHGHNVESIPLDNARALRIAELINDYRTLLIYIMNYTECLLSLNDYRHECSRILIQSRQAAQGMLIDSYMPPFTPRHGRDEGEMTTQLKYIIIDSSARRHQAYKIYLSAAAATRWLTSRTTVLNSKPKDLAKQLGQIDAVLDADLDSISDQSVAVTLGKADLKAGYWLEEDPSLPTILSWTGLTYLHKYIIRRQQT